MAGKILRKSRNPGIVDNWLDTMGFYRKNVAYDETCLFRAISEQLFDCQLYHERVRKDCIEYATKNYEEFRFLEMNEFEWNEHLIGLCKHMVVCGNIEIQIISRKYNRDVLVFDAVHQEIYDITKRNLPKKLYLCLMDEGHYDVVYKREQIVTAGFCQSMVYKLLYEDVFKIENVDKIVNSMLYDKASLWSPDLIMDAKKFDEESREDAEVSELDNQNCSTNIAPFPFKVAKALDPTIYRNIEYDSWGEVRREMRLGDWYYGDDKLILGTRCILNDPVKDETYDCYIQEILKESNKCVVYLTKFAEKRTVNYTDLSPENDAKPWPLPYRFSKNLVIGTTQPILPEKASKNTKKRNKEKRRTKSCSESSVISIVNATESVENVNAYVGIPLQMSSQNEPNFRQADTQTETIKIETPAIQTPDLLVTQDAQNTPNRYTTTQVWDTTHWHHTYLPPTPDPFVWPQTPTTPQNMFNFGMKPMVASAPVTPDVVPYHDPNFPYYYNYHVDPYHPYPQWAQIQNEYALQQTLETFQPEKPEHENPKIKHEMSQTEAASHHTQTEPIYEHQHTEGRPTLLTTLPNPPVEVYSPMIIPPGTPVIYTQTHDMSEIMMPTTPIMYTPPVDVQYVSPGPYVYPPTPPAAWYPAGINSQGFIFPQTINNQNMGQK